QEHLPRVEELIGKLKISEGDVQRLIKISAGKQARIEHLEARVEALENAIDQKHDALKEKGNEYSKKRIDELKSKLADSEKREDEMKKRIDDLSSKLEKSVKREEEQTQRVNDLTNQLEEEKSMEKTPKCIVTLCKKYPSTPYGYIRHLDEHHKTTLLKSGIYLHCSCGITFNTKRDQKKHDKKCSGNEFTLHKLDED
ncbi:hypothetical protein PMAYCL1PPCAC_04268, partial [Pristionchus mayeri]